VNVTDAAVEVLRREGGRTMTVSEIAERLLASGLVSLASKTPEASISARLYVDAKKADGKVERAGRGAFRLREQGSQHDA
jgi:restriction system protein